MEKRYSVVTIPEKTLMRFDTAQEVVSYLSLADNIGCDAVITDGMYSELNIKIKCNVHSGNVEAMPHANGKSHIHESYPFLTKPIETAISNFAIMRLRERLLDDTDATVRAINYQVRKNILEEIPATPTSLVSALVNFSIFGPTKEYKTLMVGEKIFDLKSLSIKNVDDIIQAANSVSSAPGLALNK